MKKCSKCKIRKREFTYHSWCKFCLYEYNKKNYSWEKRKIWLLKKFGTTSLRRKYPNTVRRIDKKYQKKRRKNNPGYKTEEYRKYWLKYPEKVRAQQALNRAIKSGKIKRSPCVDCGATYRIHGHHPNYSKPLEVIWVCSIHHKNYHS